MSAPANIWLWVLVILALTCSFLFSALETAFTYANWSRIKGVETISKKTKKLSKLNDNRKKVMATILVGDTLCDLFVAASVAILLTQYFSPIVSILLSVAALLVLILFIGEILPKSVGRQRPEAVLSALFGFLKAAMAFFTPLVLIAVKVEEYFERWIGPKKNASEVEAELITIVSEAQNEGGMDEEEGELIRSAIEFRDLDAQDILTPRVDVVGVNKNATMEETLHVFVENEFTRIPVYEENMDKIVGILHQKDFFIAYYNGEKAISAIMKPALFAPSTLKTSKLLRLLQENKSHMAIMVDEFGGTEGIATMEDILEELVGEIYDEHDDIEVEIEIDEEGNYLVDGSTDLEEVLEEFDLPDTYETDTVAGWVAEIMEKIPLAGDSFEVGDVKVIVTQAERKRVSQVKIIRLHKEELPENQQE